MTLEEVMKEHRIQHIRALGIGRMGQEEVTCACGHTFPSTEEHDRHRDRYVSEWMRVSQFGNPFYWLSICLRCGVIVGNRDIHRKACGDG